MGREALCAQCLSVWIYIHTHIYIYFFYICTPFLLVIKPLSYWEQDLDNYLCGFFFLRKNTFGKYSVLMITWGIHTCLFSLNVTWRCEGHQLWKLSMRVCIFLSKLKYFWEQKHNCIISVQSTKLLSKLECNLLNLMYLRNVFFKRQVTFSYTAV